MTLGTITHKGFVNTWECDENDHLNVQFYWRRFGDALQIFQHLSGQTRHAWKTRHVRYHSELRKSATTTVHSASVTENGAIVHQLLGTDGVSLSATAIDTFEVPVQPGASTLAIMPESARARSLPEDHILPVDADQKVHSKAGLLTHRSMVTPKECDEHGFLLDEGHIGRFSDAAGHLWHHLGVSYDWLADKGLGSVAVEMAATRHKPVKAGMMVEIVSWVETVREKTFSFRHQVSDMQTGEPLYSGAVTALMMDQTERRAVALPPDFAARLSELIGESE